MSCGDMLAAAPAGDMSAIENREYMEERTLHNQIQTILTTIEENDEIVMRVLDSYVLLFQSSRILNLILRLRPMQSLFTVAVPHGHLDGVVGLPPVEVRACMFASR